MAKRMVLLLVVVWGAFTPMAIWANTAADCDFDDSGWVDFADFLVFAGAYGSFQTAYDLNGNGSVDFPDFLTFVRFYGQKVGQPTAFEMSAALPGGATMDMVWATSGRFVMGSVDSDLGRDADEGPRHTVTISRGFYLGKYEVTQGQWASVMGTTPWQGKNYVQENPDHPATYVSWEDAQAFVQRLNTAAGDSLYRLPTEAEWEYACRAGTTSTWSFGDDELLLGDYAWYYDNAGNKGEAYAHRVGLKRPNPWGLYDMHGNVWEWCQDWYGVYSDEGQDPAGPELGSLHVLRGGDFNYNAGGTRSASRYFALALYDAYIGFRVLREER